MTDLVHDLRKCFEISAPEERTDTLESIWTALQRRSETEWLTMFQEGILSTLFDFIFEVEFCGFTVSEIRELSNDPEFVLNYKLVYIGKVLIHYSLALTRLKKLYETGSQPSVAEETVRTIHYVLSRTTEFWGLVYEAREGLLVDDWTEDVDGRHWNMLIGDIAHTHIGFADVMTLNGPIPGAIDMALVMLYIWAFSKDSMITCPLILTMMGALEVKKDRNVAIHEVFLQKAFEGTITPNIICAAIKRDFLAEAHINQSLSADTMCIQFQELLSSPESPYSFDRTVLVAALAAGRRQLCIGKDDRLTSMIIITIVSYSRTAVMHTNKNVPEERVHAIVVLLVEAMSAFIAEGSAKTGYAIETLEVCTTALQVYRVKSVDRPIPATLRAIRRFSFEQWTETRPAFDRAPISDRLTLIRLWKSLGRILTALADAPSVAVEAESAFLAQKRCGWGKCLCSVHKPAHSLRACAGCWSVFYCGPKCQTSDWTIGGHKERCPSARSAKV